MRGSRAVTPELVRHVQYRYEETDEPVASIAADCDLIERTIYKWAVQHGWCKRRDRPPRDVPPELRLNLDLDRALEEMEAGADLQPAPADSAVPSDAGAGLRPAASVDDAAPSDALAVAERLERQLVQNLARVERMRETQWPQSTADAERSTRALERLTAALLKVRQLRNPDANTANTPANKDDFDIPADIDEFRRALAHRIRAFVRSRTGEGVSGAGEAQGAG